MIRGEYEELATQEQGLEGETEGESCDDDEERFGNLFVQSRAYCPYEDIRHTYNAPLDAHDLLRYVETRLSKRRPPQFCLKVRIFPSTDSMLPTSTLTIPLPHLTPASRMFYCRADDAPSLRGAHSGSDHDDRSLGNLDRPWSLKSNSTHATMTNGRVRLADKITVSRWNARIQRNLCGPWKPLSERPSDDLEILQSEEVSSTEKGQFWPNQANRSLALQAMQVFTKDVEAATKYLICPESCYGWDLDFLQDTITNDLQRTRAERTGNVLGEMLANVFHQPNRIAKISIESRAPALAARRIQDRRLEAIAKRIRWLSKPESPLIAIVMGFTSVMICILMLGMASEYAIPLYLVITPLIVLPFISVALAVLSVKLMGDAGTVHEAVGIAWALKKWVAVPDHLHILSYDDALAAVPSAFHAQRVGKKWYALIGKREGQWWSENRLAVLNAIKQGRQGTLFIDEMHNPFFATANQHGEEHSSVDQASSLQQASLPAYDQVTMEEGSEVIPLMKQS